MSNKLVLTEELQNKVLKVRIYPINEQVSLLNQTFGCCRKLYNEHLQERNEFYIANILPIKSKATKQEINEVYKTFKPKTEKEWKVIYPYLAEVSSCALQQARRDCDSAFLNFSNRITAQEKENLDSQSSNQNIITDSPTVK